MSALEEIQAGAPGRETLDAVLHAAGRATRRFPPRAGYQAWSQDAVADEVAEMFERQPFLLTKALISGLDTDSKLQAYLVSAFGNALKDKAKATDIGKLRRRFVTVLGSDDRFVHSTAAGETWSLVELQASRWSGHLTELRSAAAEVRGVFIGRMNSAGPTPAIVRDALRTISAAVLDEACGAVPAQDLARVVFDRFFPAGPSTVSLDAAGGDEMVIDQARPEAEPLCKAAARAVFGTLDGQDKALLPYLGRPPEARLGLLEGVGPHETEAIAASLTERIRRAVINDDQAEQVVLSLLDLCRDPP